MLVATLELLYGPLSNLVLLLVLKGLTLGALWKLEGDSGGRARDREFDTNLGGEVILRELSTYLHCEAQAIPTVLIDERVDAEWGRILAVYAIVHDKELAIRRVDRHGLHRLKVVRINALMKVAVIENNASLLASGASTHSEVIVEHQA